MSQESGYTIWTHGSQPGNPDPFVETFSGIVCDQVGKVDCCLCLRFTPTFIYDQDVAMWPLPHTTTVTQRGPPHGYACRAGTHHCEKTPRVTSHPRDSPHPLPSQLRLVRQSSKVPTWKLHSVSPGSLHTQARAVCEALAKRRLYLESKHFHSWVLREIEGGRDRGYFVSSIPPSTRLSPAGWWVISGHPPGTLVQALFPGPTSILPAPWIPSHGLIPSFLPVHLVLCPT